MSLSQPTEQHKSTGSQDTNHQQPAATSSTFDRFRVAKAPEHKFLRLKHSFIRAWASALTGSAFKVFCVVHMWADFRDALPEPDPASGNGVYATHPKRNPNPNFGHTNGYHSAQDVARVAGISLKTARRALKDLVTFGLLRHSETDPKVRARNGTSSDWIINQDVQPPSGDITLTPKGLAVLSARRQSNPTLVTSDQGPYPPVTRVPGHPRPGSLPTSDQGPYPPVTRGKEGVETVESLTPPVSSSSSLEPRDNPTTTTMQSDQREDLTKLRHIGSLVLDDDACRRLWEACRQDLADVTVDEVAHCASAKLYQVAAGNSIRQPIGFILTAVPNSIRAWAERDRADRAKASQPLSDLVRQVREHDQRLVDLIAARQQMYRSIEWQEMSHEQRSEAERRLNEHFGVT